MSDQKTTEDYRRNIFTLKEQIQDAEKQLSQLKEEYTQYSIFEPEAYDVRLKAKILELAISQLSFHERKFLKHKASEMYCLDFAIKKLLKSCEILSILPDWVLRGADKKFVGEVSVADLTTELKQVYGLPLPSINSIIDVLDAKNNKGNVSSRAWRDLLDAFLLNKQPRPTGNANYLDDALERIVSILVQERIMVQRLWKDEKLDIGEFALGIISEVGKDVQLLDLAAVYSRFDPTRQGYVETRDVVLQLKNRIDLLPKGNKAVKIR